MTSNVGATGFQDCIVSGLFIMNNNDDDDVDRRACSRGSADSDARDRQKHRQTDADDHNTFSAG